MAADRPMNGSSPNGSSAADGTPDGGAPTGGAAPGAAHGTAPQKQSNWNLPNVLTTVRIIMVPFFVWALWAGGPWGEDSLTARWIAFVLFGAAMYTDKLDGDIARARNIVTDFGKIADPIADKALMITALVTLNIAGPLPVWITVVIIVRELGITFWRMWMLRQGQVVPASKGGKLKTVLQTLGVGMYLCPLPGWMDMPTLIVMLIAVAVTVITGVQYLVDARKANDGA